ncbi:unnamed protein product [Brachionus calyciflorus]|uniref:Uncharacterized protein n=1 Tax=Brachionus calyciflorus TaxID=104777 RepID=A0A813M495_9BILA|nr:unnamed protein product [Brachionus calyciflorus]
MSFCTNILIKFNLTALLVVMFFVGNTYQSYICPLFKCSPDIVSLNHYTLNSTFDIICKFSKKVEDPSDIVWKFNMGNHQRIITDMDGGVLAPFKHTLINDDSSFYSISKLTVYLVNASYYTNYSLLHLSDMCQQNVRINLQERALSYTNGSSKLKFDFVYKILMIFAIVHKIRIR